MTSYQHGNCTDANSELDTTCSSWHIRIWTLKTTAYFLSTVKNIEGCKIKYMFHLPQVFFSGICRTAAKLCFAVQVKICVNLHIFRSEELHHSIHTRVTRSTKCCYLITRDDYLIKSPYDFTVFHIFSTLLENDFHIKVFVFFQQEENKTLYKSFVFSLKIRI